MFSIAVNELIKRPGEMRELVMQFDMDHELGTGYAAVQKGQWLKLDLRLESVHEGILATGDVFTEAKTECSRCLDEINLPIEVDFQELFAYSSSSDDELLVDGDHIDLEQVVIDSVVLSLPFQPVCSPDCLGLCAECGFRLSENPDHKHEAKIDSRFSALEGFLSKEE